MERESASSNDNKEISFQLANETVGILVLKKKPFDSVIAYFDTCNFHAMKMISYKSTSSRINIARMFIAYNLI